MILYTVFDTEKKTFAYPLIAESEQQVQESLNLMNPENLSSLQICTICPLSHPQDIFLLSINPEKKLPAFLTSRSAEVTSSATQQPEGARSSALASKKATKKSKPRGKK